jgi:hypothetical protein
MKRLGLIVALAAFAAPVAAGPADDLIGTWECRAEGAPPTKTPPIVWFGPGGAETSVELDAFARTVSGMSDVSTDAEGWWKVQPQSGDTLLIKPLPPFGKNATPAMSLKRGNESYQCLRLPKYI